MRRKHTGLHAHPSLFHVKHYGLNYFNKDLVAFARVSSINLGFTWNNHLLVHHQEPLKPILWITLCKTIQKLLYNEG